MKKKFVASLLLASSVMLFSIVSSAFAAQENSPIYENGSYVGYTTNKSNILLYSDNTVGLVSSTQPIREALDDVDYSYVAHVAYKNGFYAAGDSDTAYPIYSQLAALIFTDLGLYNSSVKYSSSSTHYVYNVDGVKTGTSALTNTGFST